MTEQRRWCEVLRPVLLFPDSEMDTAPLGRLTPYGDDDDCTEVVRLEWPTRSFARSERLTRGVAVYHRRAFVL
eukprot:COSAG01_NODE_2878_length_6926_cov_5.737073_4_plen_73_part_00